MADTSGDMGTSVGMGGWQALIWGATSSGGVLVFLKAVANVIEQTEKSLRAMEVLEREQHHKRQARRAHEQDASVT